MENAVKYIVEYCGNLVSNENVVIIYDVTTAGIVAFFKRQVETITPRLTSFQIDAANVHGIEPPSVVSAAMYQADLIICLTKTSLAHTTARLEATNRGARFMSLPEYSEMVLRNPAIFWEYRENCNRLESVSQRLTRGKHIFVTTKLGTKLQLDIEGREGNCCPGFVDAAHRLGSPPDAEVNIAPLEEKSEGIVIVDGSITCEEIGRLKLPVELIISKGKITEFKSANKEYEMILQQIFRQVNSEKAYFLAECGIGFNDKAQLCGNMLVDEGTYGCVHFGFGSNYTINGKNKVGFHLDFVVKEATMKIDEEIIIKDGKIIV